MIMWKKLTSKQKRGAAGTRSGEPVKKPAPVYKFDKSEVTEPVKLICKPFLLNFKQTEYFMDAMDSSIKQGLGAETNQLSKVKCYPTYIQDLPEGSEEGKFLALDLGGTNFRVLYIHLGVDHYYKVKSEVFKVPAYIQRGNGTELFDHIAKSLSKFIIKYKLNTTASIPLGFTFSFPLKQVGLNEGYLISWTKGYNCSGVVGMDVVQLLKDAIKKRKGLRINVCGILNDTTGTLMSCAWNVPDTRVGLIVGTGCNACYLEKVENVELFDGDKSKSHVVVNTEWGAFGDDGQLDAIRTKYDVEIDVTSLNAGKQKYEKMISGMYMGELVRLIIMDLVKEKNLFDGQMPKKIGIASAFESAYISTIEGDKENYKKTRSILKKLGVKTPSLIDCINVRYICECVSRRSIHLVAGGLAVLLKKINEKSVTIGVDGSVFRCHPFYTEFLSEKTKELVNPDMQFNILLSQDGSGRGAALVAAVVSKLKKGSSQIAKKK